MTWHERRPGSFTHKDGDIMPDTITLTGWVVTEPRVISTAEGLHITSFRLGSKNSHFDRKQQRFVDEATNFYNISTYRHLAENVGKSISKGDQLVVTGKLKVQEWQSGERAGINVEVEAEAIGHNLYWGQSHFMPRSPKGLNQKSPVNAPSGFAGNDPHVTDEFPDVDAVTGTGSGITTGGPSTGGAFGLGGNGWPVVAAVPSREEDTTPF
jgi:single-strand DNA-binding protein